MVKQSYIITRHEGNDIQTPRNASHPKPVYPTVQNELRPPLAVISNCKSSVWCKVRPPQTPAHPLDIDTTPLKRQPAATRTHILFTGQAKSYSGPAPICVVWIIVRPQLHTNATRPRIDHTNAHI